MGDKKNGSALERQGPPESIVAFYITQEDGLPTSVQGFGHTAMAINVLGPSQVPIKQNALKVTFPINQSTEEPLGLVAFGSDPRCHFRLLASDACHVHCKVWAQLNSGPDVWIIEDSSVSGTQILDKENPENGIIKTVRGRRQASIGLQSIKIGSCTFVFRAPVDKLELRNREEWFRCHPPVPLTKAMIDRQLSGCAYDLCRMEKDPIGEGGNAKVYKFMENNTALLVAIKEEETKNQEHKRMVMKEINFMKALRHVSLYRTLLTLANSPKPFLIDILFDDSDNKPLPTIRIGMPLCLGDLRSILPLPSTATTERLMVQIAEGLRFMHSHLILHRDLKPGNILVVSPENVKIADYGWAASLTDTGSLYDVCGTVAYCAPEALKRNEIHTPSIDIYSLGAVFYEMLDLKKVERGWVERLFRGRKEIFNTTFENASKSPPHLFAGLIQSMLAPNPKGRCSLDESIEVVKAQNHNWTKHILVPEATSTYCAAAQFGTQKTTNPTILQQTPFGRTGNKAKIPKPTPTAQNNWPENRQNSYQALIKNDLRRPAWERQEPAAPALRAPLMQKPRSKPAHVQGINFNARLPSYEEATCQNPFAPLALQGGKKKKSSHREINLSNIHPAYRPKGPLVQQAATPMAHNKPRERGVTTKAPSVAKVAPLASTHRRPRNSRAVNLHRARDAGIHRRQERPNRQAARYERLAEFKRGACHVAKGWYIITRAVLGLACEELLVGGERVYNHFKDDAAARVALEHAATGAVNVDARLVASVQRHSLAMMSSSRRTGGEKQRVCTDTELLDRQLMLSRRR